MPSLEGVMGKPRTKKVHTGAEETQGAKSKSCKKKVLGQQVKLRNLARPGKVAQWDHRGWGYERMFLVSQVMVPLQPSPL